jgi:uncharacterized protein YecT (DUF1311 family)
MASPSRDAIFETSYSDLSEGPKIPILRLRQLSQIVQDDYETRLWPLVIVNAATCLEWYARTVLKHLIDYAAERINPDARVLRDLKINYALILQAHVRRFSIGDIVAMSRNFSSFDDIDTTLNDLMKQTKPPLVVRVKKPLVDLIADALRKRTFSKKALARELNLMFQKRNELVHGTPRYLSYENELDSYLAKSELLKFIHCALYYVTSVESAVQKFVPELSARSTYQMNINQRARLTNSDREVERLEKKVERRIGGNHLRDFRRAQRAWRLWRARESVFQTADWEGGSGRTAIQLSYETSINLERLRSREAYIRQIDKYGI